MQAPAMHMPTLQGSLAGPGHEAPSGTGAAVHTPAWQTPAAQGLFAGPGQAVPSVTATAPVQAPPMQVPTWQGSAPGQKEPSASGWVPQAPAAQTPCVHVVGFGSGQSVP